MNIYLVGMMGSGKTVTGKALASLTGFRFIDLDQVIESEQGMTIAVLFEKKGESFFRDLETQALKAAAAGTQQVISTGGGIVLRPENREIMKNSGTVVFLETGLPWLLKRLRGSTERPLLKTPDWANRVEQLVKERMPLYKTAASVSVLTDGKTAAQAAGEIVSLLGIQS